MFCPECDGILIPNKSNGKMNGLIKPIIYCKDCNYKVKDLKMIGDFVIKDTIEHDVDSLIEVVGSEIKKIISPELREELREQYREALEI